MLCEGFATLIKVAEIVNISLKQKVCFISNRFKGGENKDFQSSLLCWLVSYNELFVHGLASRQSCLVCWISLKVNMKPKSTLFTFFLHCLILNNSLLHGFPNKLKMK